MVHGVKNLNLKLISSKIFSDLVFCNNCISVYFSLPQPIMTNSDLGRLLKAFEIQSVLRPPMYVEI
jgi:hypothetical protein